MVIHHRISGSSLLGGCSPCWVYVFAAEPLTDQWYLHNLYLLPRDAVTAALHLLDKDFQLTDSLNRELLTIYKERQPSVWGYTRQLEMLWIVFSQRCNRIVWQMKSMGKYLETPHHKFWKSNKPSAEPPPTSGEPNGDPDRNPSPSSDNHGGNEAHANGI